jgi:hypothetical protein
MRISSDLAANPDREIGCLPLSLERNHRFEVSFESVERVVVELRVRRHRGRRIHRMWIGYIFSEVILGRRSALGKLLPRVTRPMTASATELVAGNTAADRDFLAFHDFRIVSALLWRETPERLGEARQFKRSDSGRESWFFAVTVDCFLRGKRFVNDAVRSKPASVLRIWPVGRRFTIELQEKNWSMPGEIITIIILLYIALVRRNSSHQSRQMWHQHRMLRKDR